MSHLQIDLDTVIESCRFYLLQGMAERPIFSPLLVIGLCREAIALKGELEVTRGLLEGFVRRVAAQSELLSRRAERKEA